MTLIVDASALYAQADADERRHAAVTAVLRAETGPLVTAAFAVAEADHLILSRLGLEAELAFFDDLAAGTYAVECLDRRELGLARDLARRHRDLRLGVADTALAVLAARHRTTRILTLDERGFRAITPLRGDAFQVLPADL